MSWLHVLIVGYDRITMKVHELTKSENKTINKRGKIHAQRRRVFQLNKEVGTINFGQCNGRSDVNGNIEIENSDFFN